MEQGELKAGRKTWMKPEARRIAGGSAQQTARSGADGSGFS
jgi:hypothetical protein